MTHPDDLLADYVDGTLEEAQRADVDAHLAGCLQCREEIALAQRAVTALEGLDEVPVPFGVTGPVIAEAGRRFERRRKVAWERLQWSAGLAAAAALILVVVLNLGGEDQRPGSLAASAATGATARAGSAEAGALDAQSLADSFEGLERQRGVNYDAEGIRSVARETVATLQEEAAQATATDVALEFAAPGRAIACVARSGAPVRDPRDTLLRLIEAEFEGTPAYIAAFVEGPGADQPPDRILIWVAATDDCRFLGGASQRL